MEVLSMMQIVWPSAGRALELLRGSKVNPGNVDVPVLPMNSMRHKRSAEQPLEDSMDRSQLQTSPGYASIRPRSVPSNNFENGYISDGIHLRPPPATSHPAAPFFPSYEHWPAADSAHNTSGSFPTLSTSVLPQVFSTGLVDERGNRVSAEHGHPSSNGSHQQRYPHYWNDYSTLSPLVNTYNGFHDPVPGHGHAPIAPLYLSDQYNNNL